MVRLLKAEDVADILGIKLQTVYLYVHQNRIPYVRISGKILRFRSADIDDWLENKRKNPLEQKKNGNGNGHKN